VSIVTKTGDSGTTGLMYNRRVPKSDPRVEACGNVDELNAALGLARATAEHEFVRQHVLEIQTSLVTLMGELATLPEDRERYAKDGYPMVNPPMTASLDQLAQDLEAQQARFKGWAKPGGSLNSAALDLARTVCRRAERRVCGLCESNQLPNQEVLVYLNRLSDILWLLARWVDAQGTTPAGKTP
jgi:cob(I)alamin adenosyltransferase